MDAGWPPCTAPLRPHRLPKHPNQNDFKTHQKPYAVEIWVQSKGHLIRQIVICLISSYTAKSSVWAVT
jgi:hypothetical protein